MPNSYVAWIQANDALAKCMGAQKVEAFLDLKKSFDEEKAKFSAKEQVDLIFEFQAYLEDQITVAQQSMAEELDFSFLGAKGPNEAGHVANMTNQLRVILQAIRIEALSYQSDHGANDLRQCPHCGLLWAKVEGCDGGTTCGSIPATPNDLRVALFDMPNLNRFDILSISIFSKITISILISISIFLELPYRYRYRYFQK